MPALPVVVGGFWGGVRATVGGVQVFHSMAWRQTSALPAGQAMAGTIADGIAQNWMAKMGTALTTQYVCSEAFVYSLESATAPAEVRSATDPGTDTGQPAPDQVACLIHHSVPVRGHGSSGRTYLPGWRADRITADGKTLDANFIGLVAGGWSDFVEAVQNHVFLVDGATVAFAVMSRVHSTVTPRSASRVEPIIATQRRRLVR